MSAMIGSGDAFLISTIACAASLVGTATRTMRQLASFRRAISLSVAFTSRVSAFVIDCTTISAAPPITTSPTRTGMDLRRALMTSSQHIVICHESDQSKQQSEADIVHHLFTGRVHRSAADQLQHEKRRPAPVEGRKRQDVGQAQAEAQKGGHLEHRQDSGLRRAGGGLDDPDRALQASGSEQATQTLISDQQIDAAHDAGNRISGVFNSAAGRFDRSRLPRVDGRMKTQDVGATARVQLRGHRQRQRLTAALDDDSDRSVLCGIQRVSKILELPDWLTVDRLDHIAVAEAGRAGRGAGIDGADLDWGLDLRRTDRGVDAEENQHGKGEVEGRPGDDDDEPLPEWMGVEAARPGIHAAVHAGQLDEAAQRDGPDGIQRLAALPAKQLRAEADAELLDLDT